MKAIETVYNGYKFRSRLEARWAVFFLCSLFLLPDKLVLSMARVVFQGRRKRHGPR